jgi:hypothetical protein
MPENNQTQGDKKFLNEISKAISDHTDKITQLINTLALSGVAIVWLFIDKVNGNMSANILMIIALTLFIISILLTLTQLLLGLIAFQSLWNNPDSPLKNISLFTWILFYLKVGILFIGFVCLAIAFISKIHITGWLN